MHDRHNQRGAVRALIFALAISAAICSSPSIAQEGRSIQIMGFGADTCGAFTNGRSQAEENDFASQLKSVGRVQWILGYATSGAISSEAVNTGLSRTDPNGILAWLDGYCRDHPLETLFRAAEALTLDLRKL